ncbi:PrsW family glutamic-type intramembrane protease [Chloroflexota bacterium]
MTSRWFLLAPLIALFGGVFAVIGAIFEEALHYSFFGPFIVAPIVEEALKPSGVYLLLAKWPYVLRSRIYTAYLAALGGLVFAAIENALYLWVYIEDPDTTTIMVRWIAGPILHMGCSFIVGFGINEKLLASVKGEVPLLSGNKKFFIIPMVIHGLYNTVAVILWAIMGE